VDAHGRWTRTRVAAAASAGALLALPAAGQPSIDADLGSRWLRPDEAIELRVDADTYAARSELRVFAGATDVSAWISSPRPGVLRLASAALRWPQGSRELVVYRIDGASPPRWRELARLPLKVLDTLGFESSTFKPRAELQLEGRAAEERDDGQPHTPRGRHLDAGARAGIEWQAEGGGRQWQAQANTQGASERSKALRAGERGAAAPRVDLADYRVTFVAGAQGAQGAQRLELGHVSHGNHPLLISSMASRGLSVASKLGSHADLSLAAMNGSAIVGWNNPLGLAEDEHRIQALTLATELVDERPGALRAELTLLDASLLPRSGFDQGQVPDAEESRGLGLRLLWQHGRLRGDLAWARSRHLHPFDAQLALAANGGDADTATVAVRPVTRDAHRGELHWDLLDAGNGGSNDSQAPPPRATLSLLHERSAPLYRSLAASFASDQMHTRLALDAAWQGATTQWHAAQRVDNLARLATLLRTGTTEWGGALRLPLPAWMAPGAPAGSSLWPTASLSWQQTHQLARNAPDTAQSGIAASHRPDQLNRTAQLQLNWQRGQGSLGYTLAVSDQDNRQSGRERADFRNLSHQFALVLALAERWRGQASVQRSRNASVESALVRRVESASLGVEGTLTERLSLSSNVSASRQSDSAGDATARQIAAQAQANWRFDWALAGQVLPAQAFVRSGLQDERQNDRRLGTGGSFRAWWVDVGLSISH
jgi:hypothetical protein